MGQIKVEKTPIEGLYVIEPTVHQDMSQKDQNWPGLSSI
mgnify:FL=1